MTTFEDLGLQPEILKAIKDMGFVNPTPIQEKTIPAILSSEQDIIALAQTGTGKTAGFGLPIIQKIDEHDFNIQAIILCPTRELCLQITKDLENFSNHLKKIQILAVYGGASVDTQVRALKKGAHIVVGTPGRTLDLIKRGTLKINNIKWLVLDEADEMLNMGFREDLDSILETTPSEKQTLLFSATMPAGVKHITKDYMNDPLEIAVAKKNIGASNISHEYYVVRASDKYSALKRLADINPDVYGIVFCRTRQETKDLADKLIQDGYNADSLHGDLTQAQRDIVMNRFRSKKLQLLVATDVAARGIDVTELTHVINYNIPDDLEVYVHRSGRTGRAGNKGTSIIICHTRETRRIKELERMIGKEFEYKNIPGGKEICEKRLFNLMDKIEKMEIDEEQIAPFLPIIKKKLDWIDKDELLKRFVSVEFNAFLEYYAGAPDINASADKGKRDDRRDDRRDRDGRNDARSDSRRGTDRGERRGDGDRDDSRSKQYARLYFNIGTKHKVKPNNLIGMINEQTDSNDIGIGKIEMLNNFSFVEVEKKYEKQVVEAFSNASFGGTKLVVETSKPSNVEGRPSFRDKPFDGGYKKPRSGGGDRRSFGGGDRRSSGGGNSSQGGRRRRRRD